MRALSAMLVLSVALPVAACNFSFGDSHDDSPGVAASGSGTTQSYAITGFHGIELRGSDDVEVTVGPAFAVRAEGPADQLDQLRIARDGASLKIDRRSGIGWRDGGSKVRIMVSMPAIDAASLAGSGNLTIDRAAGTSFEGSVAGSGDLLVRALKVDQAKFDLAGSGYAAAAGTTKALTIDIAGSGDVKAPNLIATSATISIAGSGGVQAQVDGAATVDIMGSGDVDLGPKARCQTSKMGSGSVRCGR